MGGKGWRRSTISHDAALYLPPKWHLYLPKLSFDSLPHTEPQITFNTDIKSGSKECQWRWRRWRAALLSADSAAAARPASVTHTCQENYQEEEEEPVRTCENMCATHIVTFLTILQLALTLRLSTCKHIEREVGTPPKGDLIYSPD